jgi:hypothetical protein
VSLSVFCDRGTAADWVLFVPMRELVTHQWVSVGEREPGSTYINFNVADGLRADGPWNDQYVFELFAEHDIEQIAGLIASYTA